MQFKVLYFNIKSQIKIKNIFLNSKNPIFQNFNNIKKF